MLSVMTTIRIATRKSPLALWQAEHIKHLLIQKFPHIHYELIPIVSSGDRFQKDTLAALGGKGAFVKELEHALFDGRAEIAVHSMKDVPVDLPQGLMLAAYLKREDPRDAFVSQHFACLEDLPQGAKLGTASLRRKALLKHLRPDLQIDVLRGNVNTRLAKLHAGEFDALIFAAAGLTRLGFQDQIKEYLTIDQFLPAITQGILGIECHVDNSEIRNMLTYLNDPTTEQAALTERAFNRRLGGACHVPVAGYAMVHDKHLHMKGLVAKVDGSVVLRSEITGLAENGEALGTQLAEQLIAQGADEILKPYVNTP
jgi:hydroxymethylbilane synthase